MLHISTRNTDGITDAVLPPRTSRGKFRLLTITMRYLGFRSVAQEYERYAAVHDDIELVCVTYYPPLWLRALGHHVPIPGVYDYSCERSLWALRRAIGPWFKSRLPLDRFDAVHVASQHLAVGVLEHRPRGCAVSVHIDATQMNVFEAWGGSPRWTRRMLDAEQEIFDACDVIASMSTWAADSLEHHYGVQRSKIVLAPPSCDVIARPDLEPGAPARTGKPRVLFIGNDWLRKGGPDLLRWHQQRWKDRAELVVASGDCSGPPAPGVVWLGRVPRERLFDEVIPSCDMLVLPTKRDMSSWVGVEAASRGLPVIATRIGGIPDLVQDGTTGLLIEPGDEAGFIAAIERLINDRELCRSMGRAALAFARRSLDREVVCGRVVNALRAAAPTAGTAPAPHRESPAIGFFDAIRRARSATG